MIEIAEIANLHNYLVDFCKKYSEKYGDCYECPVGKQIKEYCKIDGAIRFLVNIVRNFKQLKKSELKELQPEPIWKGSMAEFKQITSKYKGNKLKHLCEAELAKEKKQSENCYHYWSTCEGHNIYGGYETICYCCKCRKEYNEIYGEKESKPAESDDLFAGEGKKNPIGVIKYNVEILRNIDKSGAHKYIEMAINYIEKYYIDKRELIAEVIKKLEVLYKLPRQPTTKRDEGITSLILEYTKRQEECGK